jgi:hypothetical protein
LFLYSLDIDECTNLGICSENSQCENTQGSYKCTCDIGYSGSSECTSEWLHIDNNFVYHLGLICVIVYPAIINILFYIELPDTFIPISFTLEDAEFTNSLNDPNSDDYQTLSAQITSNVSYTFSFVYIYEVELKQITTFILLM